MQQLLEKTAELTITDDDRIIIFSDLHVGNGKSLDDFKGNSDLLKAALRDYYYPQNYTLILNGDVEELHRYSLHEIRAHWTGLYAIFDTYFQQNRLYKIFGNHDSKLFSLFEAQKRYSLHESLNLKYILKPINSVDAGCTRRKVLMSCLPLAKKIVSALKDFSRVRCTRQ